MNFSLNSTRLDYRISLLIIVAAFLFLYFFGIQGFMKAAPFGDDFAVFYRAGTHFLQAEDPWLRLIDSGTPYSYPPHSLSLVGLYNLLPFDIALAAHTALNIFSILVLAYCANQWFLKISHYRDITAAQLLPLALLIGNPYMATSIHQGQLALPAAAAVFLSWNFLKRGHWILAGVFLGLATIKPQLSALYVLWLLFTFNIKTLLVGATLALLMIVPGALTFGFIEVFVSWITSMGGYSKVAINAPGAPYVVGLESLFAAYGVDGTGIVFKPLALMALIFLFRNRQYFDDVQILQLFFVIAFTFVYGHDYDYAAVIAIFSYCLYLTLSRPTVPKLVGVFFLMLFFFVPQRILRGIDVPLLHHTRTFLLPLCCYLVFLWSPSERKPS